MTDTAQEYVQHALQSLRMATQLETCGSCKQILNEFIDEMDIYNRVHDSVVSLSQRQDSLRTDLMTGAKEAGVVQEASTRQTLATGGRPRFMEMWSQRIRLTDLVPQSKR